MDLVQYLIPFVDLSTLNQLAYVCRYLNPLVQSEKRNHRSLKQKWSSVAESIASSKIRSNGIESTNIIKIRSIMIPDLGLWVSLLYKHDDDSNVNEYSFKIEAYGTGTVIMPWIKVDTHQDHNRFFSISVIQRFFWNPLKKLLITTLDNNYPTHYHLILDFNDLSNIRFTCDPIHQSCDLISDYKNKINGAQCIESDSVTHRIVDRAFSNLDQPSSWITIVNEDDTIYVLMFIQKTLYHYRPQCPKTLIVKHQLTVMNEMSIINFVQTFGHRSQYVLMNSLRSTIIIELKTRNSFKIQSPIDVGYIRFSQRSKILTIYSNTTYDSNPLRKCESYQLNDPSTFTWKRIDASEKILNPDEYYCPVTDSYVSWNRLMLLGTNDKIWVK